MRRSVREAVGARADLATMLRRSDLGLTLLTATGSDRLHRVIRWVTTSELTDPTPYLRGGELLLTTGMRLPTSPSGVHRYVSRLVEAGVVGVGFGIGFAHQEVPAELRRCAQEADLPLLVVDEPTPFIAIGEAVAELKVQAEVRDLGEALRAQQELTRAAASSGGEGVARRLAALIDGWVIVTDLAGRPRVEVPAEIGRSHYRWRAELGRLRGGRTASATFVGDDEHVSVQTLGGAGEVHGFLVTGRRRPPTTAHHSMTNVAAALMSVALHRASRSAGTRDSRALLMTALVDHPDVIGPLLPAVAGPVFARGPVRVLAAAGPADALDPLHRRLEALGDTAYPWAAPTGELLAVLDIPDETGDMPDAAIDMPYGASGVAGTSGGTDLAVYRGWSEPVRVDDIPRGIDQARRALHVAARSHTASVEFGRIGADDLWSLTDPVRAEAFRATMLAPLLAYEQASSVPMTASLRSWLRHHGQFDPAASELGVHRNTVRNRVRRAAGLLGRDLDDPTVRMELWFALGAAPGR